MKITFYSFLKCPYFLWGLTSMYKMHKMATPVSKSELRLVKFRKIISFVLLFPFLSRHVWRKISQS